MTDRRTAKRLATRQRISDEATRLFMQRGYDAVTVDQIAAAAGVSRMTVFNHFARKEDMLFDLDELGRQEIVAVLDGGRAGAGPIEALRRFAHHAIAERRPYVLLCEAGSELFMETVRASEALTARARGIRDELTGLLTTHLAKSAGLAAPDAGAHLAASLLVTTWTVALLEGHREFVSSRNQAEAYATFLRLVDRGSAAAEVALQGTPYVAGDGA